jgi:hypothetical protein
VTGAARAGSRFQRGAAPTRERSGGPSCDVPAGPAVSGPGSTNARATSSSAGSSAPCASRRRARSPSAFTVTRGAAASATPAARDAVRDLPVDAGGARPPYHAMASQSAPETRCGSGRWRSYSSRSVYASSGSASPPRVSSTMRSTKQWENSNPPLRAGPTITSDSRERSSGPTNTNSPMTSTSPFVAKRRAEKLRAQRRQHPQGHASLKRALQARRGAAGAWRRARRAPLGAGARAAGGDSRRSRPADRTAGRPADARARPDGRRARAGRRATRRRRADGGPAGPRTQPAGPRCRGPSNPGKPAAGRASIKHNRPAGGRFAAPTGCALTAALERQHRSPRPFQGHRHNATLSVGMPSQHDAHDMALRPCHPVRCADQPSRTARGKTTACEIRRRQSRRTRLHPGAVKSRCGSGRAGCPRATSDGSTDGSTVLQRRFYGRFYRAASSAPRIVVGFGRSGWAGVVTTRPHVGHEPWVRCGHHPRLFGGGLSVRGAELAECSN